MRYQQGKSFIAPSKLFRADKALFFPNLQGTTLASSQKAQDTTPVLSGIVSVVSTYSGLWAERQTTTFVGDNKELSKVLDDNADLIQKVDINIEENPLRAWLVKLFVPRLRKSCAAHRHPKYFMIRRGMTAELRTDIGIYNSQVGYVYLLDSNCRIRWAGSGPADHGERQSLVRGALKLVEEVKRLRLAREDDAQPTKTKSQMREPVVMASLA